ncbi:alkyl hydroperoxide reductase subunit F [Thalassotalea litorea]|uniref:Alkyl hydroperoxide reductase subunit F n=1 Tax=Thalassotalea litorea TaxID=2020715 RepID=A0A5R9IEH5_9GAMM|nr:alkyl hydroperoxide reductase subunit F [Thalassotalea litorea]TLU61010.1 alkyl hydroperoxide reductase subunit F [Thalassotalea litorea]
MLNNDILNALKAYTKTMTNNVTLVMQPGEHPKRQELEEFLEKLCSVSENLNWQISHFDLGLNSPLSFAIQVNDELNGVVFSGIPAGHEFNSLILAILQSSGTALKLDSSLQSLIKSVAEPLHFEVFVSLSCHNCPDVVQALNQFAMLNPQISSEMIDGGLYPDIIESRNIQGVPSVYLNGEPFANGKVDTAILIEKLQTHLGENFKASASIEQSPTQDVTVIGGGPAGVSAAIYSARKGLKVTLIADRIGGQVKDTVGIENLISVSKTTGSELTNNLIAHMNDYTINLKEHIRVDKIEKGDVKTLTLSSGEVLTTKTLIIATGAKWRELGVEGEKENIGQGVAYCPHCDGPFFKGKDVAVIGGGNSGVEAALDLAGMVKSVTLFEFLPELKADKVLVEKAEQSANIKIIKSAKTEKVLSDGTKVTGLRYQDRNTEEIMDVDLDGIFVQIGLVPNSEFVSNLVERNNFGEIIIDEKGQTSEPGVFACGDVTTVPYKQIVIAMGEGSKASLSAFDYLLRAA